MDNKPPYAPKMEEEPPILLKGDAPSSSEAGDEIKTVPGPTPGPTTIEVLPIGSLPVGPAPPPYTPSAAAPPGFRPQYANPAFSSPSFTQYSDNSVPLNIINAQPGAPAPPHPPGPVNVGYNGAGGQYLNPGFNQYNGIDSGFNGMQSSALPSHIISAQPGLPPPPAPPGAAVQWMPPPPTIPGCPPGLEYLTQIDKLFVNQRVSIMEAFTGWDIRNKYAILNSAGEQVYFAFEESDMMMRQMMHSNRGYTMHIVDNFNREVMKVVRPFKCCSCCWFADSDDCGAETTIEAPPGNVVGIIRQRTGYCSNNFVVRDERDKEDMLRIEGPNMCTFDYSCNCEADKVFEITSVKSGSVIGSVRRKFRGWGQESFTNADLFSVEFPLDLDLNVKALLVGATFLIDFQEFEGQGDNKVTGSGTGCCVPDPGCGSCGSGDCGYCGCCSSCTGEYACCGCGNGDCGGSGDCCGPGDCGRSGDCGGCDCGGSDCSCLLRARKYRLWDCFSLLKK